MRRALRHVGRAPTPRDRAGRGRASGSSSPPFPSTVRSSRARRPWPSCAAEPSPAGPGRCGCATTSSGTGLRSRPSAPWGSPPPPRAAPPSGRASCSCRCAMPPRSPKRWPRSTTCREAGSSSVSAWAPMPASTHAAGVEFAGRGRRLDEGIDSLRRSWAVSPGDRYAQLPAVGPIPVWVGGSSEAALRRAARRGDGWIPLFIPPDEYGAALGRLDKETERVGAIPSSWRAPPSHSCRWDAPSAEQGLSWMASLYGLPARSFERHLVTGSARQMRRDTGAVRRSRSAARGGLRHLGRPAGTVRGPGRRVRRPRRVSIRPAHRAGRRRARPLGMTTTRAVRNGWPRWCRAHSGTQVEDQVWR